MNLRSSLRTLIIGAIAAGMSAAAQTQTPATTPAPDQAPAATQAPASTPAAAPAAAPTPAPWRIIGLDVSGFLDGYYSYNANNPTEDANGKTNDYYNFNDDANQPGFSAAKLTLNHDPAWFGAHFDFVYGRTNRLINPVNQLYYVEQAYISAKPKNWKGFEVDAGKWVTSAGAETIEAKDNWNYSRSLLFAWAIPYWHFGARTSMPVTKTDTIGLQFVNGWNNITQNTGGVTVGFTNALTEPKYTWSFNVYTGPSNTPSQNAYRNLVDTTFLLTPNTKFNAYINFDYAQNNNHISHGQGNDVTSHLDGLAFAAHEQLKGPNAIAGRIEFLDDQQGYSTGTPQTLKEFTGTYEYKWKFGLISRLEYRRDWSDAQSFHRGETAMTDAQSTVSAGMILVLTPHR